MNCFVVTAATIAVLAICGAPLAADVRVTSVTSIEGGFAAMMKGMTPTVVMKIKGKKARADMDMGGMSVSTITDLEAQQFVVLNSADKTAQVLTPGMTNIPKNMVMPKIEAAIKPTGRTQTIAGVECAEHTLTMSLSMAEATASQGGAEAAAMMKDIRMLMNGHVWVASSGPGVAEYAAFQAESVKLGISKLMGAVPGMGSSGIDQMMNVFSNANGIPYLTEIQLTIEGSGPIAEVMKQQGPIKITTKVTEVSTDAIAADAFEVPADYKVVK